MSGIASSTQAPRRNRPCVVGLYCLGALTWRFLGASIVPPGLAVAASALASRRAAFALLLLKSQFLPFHRWRRSRRFLILERLVRFSLRLPSGAPNLAECLPAESGERSEDRDARDPAGERSHPD